ncbi:MAG: SAM-dependent chlorinase/fluorinase [Cyclobacteriaceae bacterium]|nr:SAM-dependent chlorinase/fluorinase [Cyclobacteriaceae bacterium]
MAIITFMSDFGMSDHYVSAVKAKILSVNPGLKIVDICHEIELHNIAHAAYVLKSVYEDFPKGTIHLISVNDHGERNQRFLAMKIDDHTFVGPDNGIFSLVCEKDPAMIAELSRLDSLSLAFPAKNILAKAAAMLASGSGMNDVGTYTKEYIRKIDRKLRATKKMISGNVIKVDHYGNLITNIEAEVFGILHKGRHFVLQFGRETTEKINACYDEVDDGDCFALFNSMGLLEIGINKGNASKLIGLRYDSPVTIFFDET